MKKIFNRIINIIPHVTIILCIMFITFWILDIYNPTMDFVNNSISNVLLLILCISAMLTAFIAVGMLRKNLKNNNCEKIREEEKGITG